MTDAALSRVLQDVLELNDIPELESHRLSELCRILNALEGLFCEDPEHVRSTLLSLCVYDTHRIFKSLQPSFVVAYVPAWLKFSYLSELLVCLLTCWHLTGNEWNFRRLPWPTLHICLSRVR